MDAGVQKETTPDASGGDPPLAEPRINLGYLEVEETPEQRLERQKNALLTRVTVRELKALLEEVEGPSPRLTNQQDEQLPPVRPQGVKRKMKRPVGAAKRSISAQQQVGPQRVTTFCFGTLEIGNFKLTAPDQSFVSVPGTNWIIIDADQRTISYKFIVGRRDSPMPYHATVNVPFSNIAAIFCGFPEIIVKLNQPAILASCFQILNSSYQVTTDVDVTDGQLPRSIVHKLALRRSVGSSFQDVLLSADFALFSSILSNGNHLSASSSLYPNFVYNQPQGPSLQQSTCIGGVPPISSSSVVPHHTYSAPLLNMGAGGVQLQGVGGVQLQDMRTEGGEGQLAQMHPMQTDYPINGRKETNDIPEMFDNGGVFGGNMQTGYPINEQEEEDDDIIDEMFGNEEIEEVLGGNMQAGYPFNEQEDVNNNIIDDMFGNGGNRGMEGVLGGNMQTGYTIKSREETNGTNDMFGNRGNGGMQGGHVQLATVVSSSTTPRCSPSSLHALSGSPVFPPSNCPTSSSFLHTPSPLPLYSMSNVVPSTPSSLFPSYPFSSSLFMTPSPMPPLSPFFSFPPLPTPTSVATPPIWSATNTGPTAASGGMSEQEEYERAEFSRSEYSYTPLRDYGAF